MVEMFASYLTNVKVFVVELVPSESFRRDQSFYRVEMFVYYLKNIKVT